MGVAGFVLGIIGLLCTTIMPFLFPHLVIATPFCVGVRLTTLMGSFLAHANARNRRR